MSVGHRLASSRKPLWGAMVIALMGIVGFGINAAHNGRYTVRPLQVSLDTTEGHETLGSFTAEINGDYEIQLEVDWPDPPGEVRRLVSRTENPSELELGWAIRSDGHTIAQGDCTGYLYMVYGNNWRLKLQDRLLGIDPGLNVLSDLVGRGVGRFTAQEGRQYELRVTSGHNASMLDPLNPRMVVRLNRVFWLRYHRQTLTLAYAGLAALGLAGLILSSWMVIRLSARRTTGQ